MQVENKSICIVASTLPVGFIAAQFNVLNIKRIYVFSKGHESSFRNLKNKNPAIEITRAPHRLLSQLVYFSFVISWARLRGTNVIFFHECCLPIIDLLLTAIRPHGYYFPQVTMSGFEEIEAAAFPRNKVYRLLQLLGVVSLFKFYQSRSIGSNNREYVMSICGYPDTIKSMDVSYSRQVMSQSYSLNSLKKNKILFVVGKTFVADVRQGELFIALASIAHAKGYTCYIKDHPNPIYRLNLHIDGVTTVDPLLPVELLDDDYHLAVGVSSSGLLGFNERAISLINMLDEISQEDRLLSIKHLEDAFPDNGINYIHSLDEFVNFL